MYARTLPGPENNPKLREFFYEDDIQLQIQVPPPPPPEKIGRLNGHHLTVLPT